jgi:cell wall-associated NlpC family hydrolase
VHTAAADQVATDKAKAAQINAQVQASAVRIAALGQQYDEAQNQIQALDQQIAATRAQIAADRHQVSGDRSTLQKAAISNYVNDDQAASANPLFDANQKTLADSQEYAQVAEGDIDTAVANLNTAQNQLNLQDSQLQSQQQAATAAANTASQAQAQATVQQQQQQAALAQANAQVQADIQAEQAAAAAAAAQAAAARIAAAQRQQAAEQAAAAAAAAATARAAATGSAPSVAASAANPAAASYVPPPPSAGGAGEAAVQAAESQLGVPYVWGGESPGHGFDCSGLVAWAWGQAGVSLPHFSGAQMADSTPVPIADLQPGDLLFYGPGGDEHVAMYIGGNQMIEAPYTGAVVWITGLRLGSGFAGAGRP